MNRFDLFMLKCLNECFLSLFFNNFNKQNWVTMSKHLPENPARKSGDKKCKNYRKKKNFHFLSPGLFIFTKVNFLAKWHDIYNNTNLGTTF